MKGREGREEEEEGGGGGKGNKNVQHGRRNLIER